MVKSPLQKCHRPELDLGRPSISCRIPARGVSFTDYSVASQIATVSDQMYGMAGIEWGKKYLSRVSSSREEQLFAARIRSSSCWNGTLNPSLLYVQQVQTVFIIQLMGKYLFIHSLARCSLMMIHDSIHSWSCFLSFATCTIPLSREYGS